MRFLPIVAVALLLTQPQSAPPPVGIEMRNVHLHVAADAALDVKWLKGRLRSTSVQPPVFDDQNSYTMEVDDGELSIDGASLTALVTRAFDYQGSALSNLRMTLEDGRLVQRGTLKKGISVPFTIVATVGPCIRST